MKGLILCENSGIKLRTFSSGKPRQLIQIADKTIIEYAVEFLKNCGIYEIGIIADEKNLIDLKQVIGNGSKWDIIVEYIVQMFPLGMIDAIKLSRNFINNQMFLMYNCDYIFEKSANLVTKSFEKSQSLCHLFIDFVHSGFNSNIIDAGNRENGISDNQIKSNIQILGLYMFKPDIFNAVENLEKELSGEFETDYIYKQLNKKSPLISYDLIKGFWVNISKPEDLLNAGFYELKNIQNTENGLIDDKSVISGNVCIPYGATVINSQIEGPVFIGKGTIIKNSKIKNSSIGEYCTINESSMSDSIVMNYSLVDSIGAIIKNSVIGEKVILSRNHPKLHSLKFYAGDKSEILL